MSGWLNRLRSKISPEHGDRAADTIEKHVTEERVDSMLNRVPGGQKLADKTPADLGSKAGDAVRDNLGSKKNEP